MSKKSSSTSWTCIISGAQVHRQTDRHIYLKKLIFVILIWWIISSYFHWILIQEIPANSKHAFDLTEGQWFSPKSCTVFFSFLPIILDVSAVRPSPCRWLIDRIIIQTLETFGGKLTSTDIEWGETYEVKQE